MSLQLRDPVLNTVSLDYFQQRFAAGWRLKAIEWEKEGDAPPVSPAVSYAPDSGEPPPYGLEMTADPLQLRQSPGEVAVLLLILELIVIEKGVAFIADQLNGRGYKTRLGTSWTSTAVFNLLPRLVEMGPELLSNPEWRARRPQIHVPTV